MGLESSGGNLNTTRREVSGAGTQTAALAFGGYTSGNVLLLLQNLIMVLLDSNTKFKHSKSCF
jgi:hypothetical protein